MNELAAPVHNHNFKTLRSLTSILGGQSRSRNSCSLAFEVANVKDVAWGVLDTAMKSDTAIVMESNSTRRREQEERNQPIARILEKLLMGACYNHIWQ